jgi:hypothetical protein
MSLLPLHKAPAQLQLAAVQQHCPGTALEPEGQPGRMSQLATHASINTYASRKQAD